MTSSPPSSQYKSIFITVLILLLTLATILRLLPALSLPFPPPSSITNISFAFDVRKIRNGAIFANLIDSIYISSTPPLLFLFYRYLISLPPLLYFLYNAALDLLSSFGLALIVKNNTFFEQNEAKLEAKMIPSLKPPFTLQPHHTIYLQTIIATFYYCNPVSIATSAADSTQPLLHFLIVFSIYFAQTGNAPACTFLLSLAAYGWVWPVALCVPVVCWLMKSHGSNRKMKRKGAGNSRQIVLISTFFFLLWSASLHLLSFLSIGNWSFLTNSYGPLYTFASISPNVGLYWYFFASLFTRFRPFFLAILHALPHTFTIPLAIRLHSYPTTYAASMLGIFAVTGAYPTMSSAIFALTLMATCPRTWLRMRPIAIYSAAAVFVPAGLIEVDWQIWVGTGSGNANYMYFQLLAYAVFLSLVGLDFVKAGIGREAVVEITVFDATATSRVKSREEAKEVM